MLRKGCLLLLGLLALCGTCLCQMESPLKGEGVPRLETDAVYVSAYLDRLLKVDQDNYRWEAVLYFYLSWNDPTAYPTVLANTKAMLTNSSYKCEMYCSNVAQRVTCCDGLAYTPSFLFKNAYGFPQDRASMYNIYTTEDGTVLREVRVHGIFYQPMDFSHYPFDSFDLLLELRFFDPTNVVDTTVVYGAEHPGVEVFPSSGGKKLFTYGKGDEAASWAVTDFNIAQYSVDMGEWFDDFSDLASHPDDPMPLAPVSADQLQGELGDGAAATNIFSGIDDQLLAVLITVERFWKPSLINAVLPVVLVFLLGMLIFFCDETELTTRIEIVVTLFLALAAVQFVLVGSIPTSSYVVPTQQLVLATYIFLFLLAAESIAVFHIVTRQQKKQQAQRRREAYRRYCQLRAHGKLAGGANPPLSAADNLPSEGSDSLACDPEGGPNGKAAAAAVVMEGVDQSGDGQGAPAAAGQGWGRHFGLCFHGGANTGDGQQRARPARVTSLSHMTADEAYAAYLGHLVDHVAAAVLGLGYVLTTVLIFTLQDGYIDLFAD